MFSSKQRVGLIVEATPEALKFTRNRQLSNLAIKEMMIWTSRGKAT
jgi:hypothetical protein